MVSVSEVYQFLHSESFLAVPLCTWSVAAGFHAMRKIEHDVNLQGNTLIVAAVQVCVTMTKNKLFITMDT